MTPDAARVIVEAVQEHHGIITDAADTLGVARTTLSDRYRRACQVLGLNRRQSPKAPHTRGETRGSEAGPTVLWLSDAHIPFQHRPTWGNLLRYVEDKPPHRLVLGGDTVDGYRLSHFSRDPARKKSFRDELEEASCLFNPFVALADQTIIVPGNHEFDRFERYQWAHPEIADLPGFNVPDLFRACGLDRRVRFMDADLTTYGGMYEFGVGEGHTYFHHGWLFSAHSAWNYLQKEFPGAIAVVGHTHRPEIKVLRSTLTGARSMCVVSGHLSDERHAGAYAKNHHWHRAFVRLQYSADLTRCQPTIVLVEDDGSFIVDGVHYR